MTWESPSCHWNWSKLIQKSMARNIERQPRQFVLVIMNRSPLLNSVSPLFNSLRWSFVCHRCLLVPPSENDMGSTFRKRYETHIYVYWLILVASMIINWQTRTIPQIMLLNLLSHDWKIYDHQFTSRWCSNIPQHESILDSQWSSTGT